MEFAKNFDNVNTRKKAVLELSRVIWDENESCCELPKIIGINGIHQDYSTDECGYHVLRFSIHLLDRIIPIHSRWCNYNWSSILNGYFFSTGLNLVRFDCNKFTEKTVAEPILLENDRNVVHYIENLKELSEFKKEGDLIEFHDEYNLSVSDWENFAKNYIKNYDSFKCEINFAKVGKQSVAYNPSTKAIIKMRQTNQKNKLRRRKKNKSKRQQIQHRAYEHEFGDRLRRSQNSLSKRIIQNLFPDNLVHHYGDPIIEGIQYSGMVENPEYLDTTILDRPGGEYSSISVRDYFKSLNIHLDETDPYSFTLCKLVKGYFEQHPKRQLSQRILLKSQEDNAKRWRLVR